MKKISSALLPSLGLCLFLGVQAFAEAPPATPTALPKKGNLATSFTGGSAGNAPGSWGADMEMGKSAAPIAGSVSKVGNTWLAKVFNNSGDRYSADVKLSQVNAAGGSVKGDYFSVTLKPGQSYERSFPASPQGVSADLELSGWKKIGGETPKVVPPAGTAASAVAPANPAKN